MRQCCVGLRGSDRCYEAVLDRAPRLRQVLGGLDSVVGMLPLESAQANEETTLLEISKSAFAYLRVAKPLLAHWLGQVVLGGQLRRIDGIVSRLAEAR